MKKIIDKSVGKHVTGNFDVNEGFGGNEGFDGIRKGNARLIFSIIIGIILLDAIIDFMYR